MNFNFSPEEEAFRREISALLDAEFAPEMERDGHGHQADTPAKRALVQKMAARGWLGVGWPEAYAPQSRALAERATPLFPFVLNETLGYRGAPTTGGAIGTMGMTILRHGSPRLKQEVLTRILAGEVQFAIGFSEPDSGSDLASLKTEAVRDGDFYVINGQKRWTSAGHYADYIWLAARTDPHAPKHRGISLLVVDVKTPGITVRPIWGLGGHRTNEVYYDNVRVPVDYRVGEENRGWYYMAESLDYERLSLHPHGPIQRDFDRLLAWARTAERNGRPLRENPHARRTLAHLAIEVKLNWMLMLRGADTQAKGRVPTIEATMNKLWGTLLLQRIADAGVDLAGPYGQLEAGSPQAPLAGKLPYRYKDTLCTTLGGGTTEIQKNVIAKRYLDLPG
jgi:alkylation response protein AidB-like acyl-CoA dehydrogenase